ncbi:hypothetical protein [Microbulbifer hainanensis]|uniref:hypothetical protein n=1 Tax=Microbulbifer hainanensis TaxID=2735675 RepID=UPI001865AA3B|nr:hypothetical protein [Microbulbifer hainanensis]
MAGDRRITARKVAPKYREEILQMKNYRLLTSGDPFLTFPTQWKYPLPRWIKIDQI